MSESKKGEKSYWFGKFGKNHNRAKSILQFSKDEIFIKEWGSMMDIERELKIGSGNISRCCSGKRKSAGSFVWKYRN